MATCNISELEPDDKDRESCIEFYLEAFRDYIASNVDYVDLLLYEHFDRDMQKKFWQRGRREDNKSVVSDMIDAILNMKNIPGRFTQLLEGAFSETENPKVMSILTGEKLPLNQTESRERMKQLNKKEFCDNLDVIPITPFLVSKGVITTTDQESIHNVAQSESRFVAAIALLQIIANRNEQWFVKLMMCLIESGQIELAQKVDDDLCTEIISTIEEKKDNLGVENLSLNTENGIANELGCNYTSLVPIDGLASYVRPECIGEEQTDPQEHEPDDNDQTVVMCSEETIPKTVDDINFGPIETKRREKKSDLTGYCRRISELEASNVEMQSKIEIMARLMVNTLTPVVNATRALATLLEALEQTISREPNPTDEQRQSGADDLQTACNNLVSEMREQDADIVKVEEGSVLLTFRCPTISTLKNIITYFADGMYEKRLKEVENALSKYVESPVKLDMNIVLETLSSALIQIEKDANSKSVLLTLKCSGSAGMKTAFEYFGNESSANALNSLSEALSRSVGERVELHATIDVNQFKSDITEESHVHPNNLLPRQYEEPRLSKNNFSPYKPDHSAESLLPEAEAESGELCFSSLMIDTVNTCMSDTSNEDRLSETDTNYMSGSSSDESSLSSLDDYLSESEGYTSCDSGISKKIYESLYERDARKTGPADVKVKAFDEIEIRATEEADVDVSLEKYQEELARQALKGLNVIIVAPTGSGKTRVALRIMQEHIRQRKGRGIAKVIFLVNQVALANQQGEACRVLLKRYSCEVITGDPQWKMKYLKYFINTRDILVVTAQVLMDAIVRKEITGISCFSLIVFDECHHTYANHTFNGIMGRYMDLKFEREDAVLPQIVGLTASVGVGKSRTLEEAVNHIKHLMANLDAQAICTVTDNITELREHVSLPEEETHKVPRRENDAFGDAVRTLMNTIENRMSRSSLVREIPETSKLEAVFKPPAQKGTTQYTQWVSKLWKETVKIRNPNARRFLISCRQHLDLYNNALIIYNDARMEDAKDYLDFEMKVWTEDAVLDDNESSLYGAYTNLRKYGFRVCPNPKLDKLKEMVLKAFQGEKWEDCRGIVFVKTRDLAKAILNWMKGEPGLRELKPIQFVGQSTKTDRGGGRKTKVQQYGALKNFHDGKHKLIIATSVSEEGIDISKCNLVIRYDHVTNEIAMVQSRGRGRVADSKYLVITEEATEMAEKEELNMIRELMMRKAIIQLQQHIRDNPEKFKTEIHKYQDEANHDRKLKSLEKKRKVTCTGQFELRCLKCNHFICWSDDVKKIEDAHHVVIDQSLEERVKLSNSGQPKYRNETIQLVGKVICRCCGANLGVICIHREVEFPVIKINSFLIVDTNGRQDTCKKWKSAPFRVSSLNTEDLREIVANFKEREGME